MEKFYFLFITISVIIEYYIKKLHNPLRFFPFGMEVNINIYLNLNLHFLFIYLMHKPTRYILIFFLLKTVYSTIKKNLTLCCWTCVLILWHVGVNRVISVYKTSLLKKGRYHRRHLQRIKYDVMLFELYSLFLSKVNFIDVV